MKTGYVLYERFGKLEISFVKEEVKNEIYSKSIGVCSETVIVNSDDTVIIDFKSTQEEVEKDNAEYFI